MSRIGKMPVVIPDKVKVNFDNGILKAKGPMGEFEINIPEEIGLNIEDNVINLTRSSEQKKVKSLHGLTRALCFNMIEGVSKGFKRVLQIEGVGYKVEMRGPRLLLSLGFSHPVLVIPPDGIQFEAEPKKNIITVSGIDKQLVGEVASRIRKIRPPEPYKGKGIRYQGEYIRRKAGKTAA